MSHVWTWAHTNPGLFVILVLAALLFTYGIVVTISNHLTIGWKAFCAIFTTDADEDEDEDEDEGDSLVDDLLAVDSPKFVQDPTDLSPHPTRFDRINKS
jgi:hypothetical protein